MVKIEHPPLEPLTNLDPLFFYLKPEDLIVRIYKSKRGALDFNNNGPRGRFDHHLVGSLDQPQDDPNRSVYYAAPNIKPELDPLVCCLAEIFGESRIIENMADKNICSVSINRQVKLLDLRGEGGMRAGSVAAISATNDRICTQAWSRYFYQHDKLYSRIDGILYSSAYAGQASVMLYERAIDALTLKEDLPLNHPKLRDEIRAIAKRLRISINQL